MAFREAQHLLSGMSIVRTEPYTKWDRVHGVSRERAPEGYVLVTTDSTRDELFPANQLVEIA